jgi:hypothetical protein
VSERKTLPSPAIEPDPVIEAYKAGSLASAVRLSTNIDCRDLRIARTAQWVRQVPIPVAR